MRPIVCRAPLRVSLGGGGTDLPSYYREHGGLVVSAAIDRYVIVTVNPTMQDRYRLKHLETEEVGDPAEIRHPILRVALSRHWDGPPLELATTAEVPPGTGLGSSGALTVCLLGALAAAAGKSPRPSEVAEAACRIELDDLGLTVGKQDQYVAAHGGLSAYSFNADDSVDVRPLELSAGTRAALRDRFLLFYTGQARSAAGVLAHQVEHSADERMTRTLDRVKEIAGESLAALEAADLDGYAELMGAQWEAKLARSPRTGTPRIDELRDAALGAGATGAVLMGAGGGGFLLVFSAEPTSTRRAMADRGARELRFDIDGRGSVARAARDL